ncbi:GNAT family N-acetyltransferase [Clostridium manihotivorum]|uniref:N-acetyltransferase n=1 Tax=Clostridium manihotivorum TaxID=2320868 RepID=A0A3R5UBS1_9CLOT|nr:GNAT family N-acetyltransferase [Clostridium manihotivorum]QAA35064.1 N-acetyltransferase [Clostridium manihotivorum]
MNCKLNIRSNTLEGKYEGCVLETERLSLLPLQSHQLKLSLDNYAKMQYDLGLRVTDTELDEEMQYAMQVRLKKVLEDPKNYLWLTNWAVILKEAKEIVGFIMLKGYPNKFGEVIVGYGITERYRKNGYASEALKAIAQWVFKNPQAKCVIADTEKGNIPSHKVLESAGAVKYKENDEIVWWRIDRSSI